MSLTLLLDDVLLCPSSFESVKINIVQLDCYKQYVTQQLHTQCINGTAQARNFPKVFISLFSKNIFTKKNS